MNAAPVRNRLLEMLPEGERVHVTACAERVALVRRQVLHHHRLPVRDVYFLESGLISVEARISSDRFVAVWLIGSEGVVGAPLALSATNSPLHRRTVQVAGRALRIPVDHFIRCIEDLPAFRSAVHAYLAAVLVQASQGGACNSAHSLKQRLARWLLLARSALRSEEIPLTHDVLAHLLAVRRASVTECLDVLRREGLIALLRGRIDIRDSDGLAAIACDCFRLIEREYARQLSPLMRPQRHNSGATAAMTVTRAPG